MDYFSVFGFDIEPFSNSPDPEVFYRSPGHEECLNLLETAIRYRDGLLVVLGDIGAGKTTLSRVLLRTLQSADDGERFVTQILSDPVFASEFQFLRKLCDVFDTDPVKGNRTALDCKSSIKLFLNDSADQDRIVTLVIDEGQKLTPTIIENLRMLLNYEHNDKKLINIVIFGQDDLTPIISRQKNFFDRIEMKYTLNPLSGPYAIKMIQQRMQAAGRKDELFTDKAYDVIVSYSNIPRNIVRICREALRILAASTTNPIAMIDDTIAKEAINRHTFQRTG